MENSQKFTFKLLTPRLPLSERKINGRTMIKELNTIQYGDFPPVIDIRQWERKSDGMRQMGKGITLSPSEASFLAENLKLHVDRLYEIRKEMGFDGGDETGDSSKTSVPT